MEINKVELEVGSATEIVLEDSRGSTGGEFMLSELPPCAFLESLFYEAHKGPAIGAPGKLIARIVGASEGRGVLGFAMVRIWELPATGGTARFEVTVKPRAPKT